MGRFRRRGAALDGEVVLAGGLYGLSRLCRLCRLVGGGRLWAEDFSEVFVDGGDYGICREIVCVGAEGVLDFLSDQFDA